MKNRNLRYLTREGIRNVGANRLMSIASVAVLMSCLVLIGCAFLVFLNIDSLLYRIESQNIIMVFVEKDADEATVDGVEKEIEKLDNIENIRFVSREAAYETVLGSLGENASVLKGVDNSFLPAGFEITVTDMGRFAETAAALKAIEHVGGVRENSDLAARLERIRTAVSYLSIGVIVLLLLVALFIIANTVRITMFTRKLEISIMKAVGATNSFIRWPFFIEGETLGVISALLAMGVLYLMYFFASDALLTIFGMLGGTLVNFWDYALYIFLAFLAVSIFTGGMGSVISIGRYLKEQGSVDINDSL